MSFERLARRRVRSHAVVLAAWMVVAGAARSDQDEIDSDLMHSIEDANKSLASNIAIKAGKGASSDAKDLADMFAQVEAFYTKRGDAPDAVQLAGKSRALTGQILQSVDTSDFGAATDSATTLSRTCKTCHNFYKKS